jgi:nuclear transport factor 2 (NTF2) superfamily protein
MIPGTAPEAGKAFVARIYSAFNARQIDRLLALMTSDVAWPNGMEGGVEHGRDAVRTYWTRQWSVINPNVSPLSVDTAGDGRLAVKVQQTIRDLAGAVVKDGVVLHIYRLREGQIAAMEIAEA